VLFRNHVQARSAVLDTLGQAHDGSLAEAGDTHALGLTVRPLTAAERLALGVDGGLVVTDVSAGRGLKAGFQPGDVVLSLDGVDVTTPDQFYKLAQKLPHDRPAPVLVHRPSNTLFLPLEAPARR
jgi:S1-C subfamily serine protease